MSGPLYVPVLPERPYATSAWKGLPLAARRLAVPLWSFLPKSGSGKRWEADVRERLDEVAGAQGLDPAWIDAPFFDGSQYDTFAGALEELAVLMLLRPVTGPGREAAQQERAVRTAVELGNGLGVRVRVPHAGRRELAEEVTALLRTLAREVELDLLVDLGAVLADRTEADKEALYVLDELVDLVPWRTIAVLGGAVPWLPYEDVAFGLRAAGRHEWRVWGELRASGRSYLPALTYGDYGIQPVAVLGQEPADRPSKRGLLRYTTEESYVFALAIHSGTGRDAHNRATARRLVALPEFRREDPGPGEDWLLTLATDAEAKTGNHTTWVKMGNLQHFCYVVEELRKGADSAE